MFPENLAHAHLLLNHLPPIILMVGVIGLILAKFWNSRDAMRLSLLIVVLAGLSCIPTYFTGEPAEDIVEGMANVDKMWIEEHEEAALIAFISMEIAAALALLSLVLMGQHFLRNSLFIPTLLVSLLAFGIVARTAQLGGKISHPEVRGGSTATYGGGHETDDDD